MSLGTTSFRIAGIKNIQSIFSNDRSIPIDQRVVKVPANDNQERLFFKCVNGRARSGTSCVQLARGKMSDAFARLSALTYSLWRRCRWCREGWGAARQFSPPLRSWRRPWPPSGRSPCRCRGWRPWWRSPDRRAFWGHRLMTPVMKITRPASFLGTQVNVGSPAQAGALSSEQNKTRGRMREMSMINLQAHRE